MLVTELLIQKHNALRIATEALQQMDWAYDIDLLNERRYELGRKQLKVIRNLMRELDENAADDLWKEYCPWAGQENVKTFLK